MGVFRKAFDSALYAIALMAALFFGAMVLGVEWQFGELFSAMGFVVLFFLIFALVAGKGERK